MATLQEIGVNGLVGLSPTPIMKYAVNKYFVNNEFLAVQKVTNWNGNKRW